MTEMNSNIISPFQDGFCIGTRFFYAIVFYPCLKKLLVCLLHKKAIHLEVFLVNKLVTKAVIFTHRC